VVVDTSLAQRLATRAIALVRAGVDVGQGSVVLWGLARGDRAALELARTRVLAALDQHPDDLAARFAVDLLDAAIGAGESSGSP
jgi:hypothetical protein